ncbi:hypothetical protein PHLGIDRAFT_15590 [Phlebiopsis gigantea 11061_1 CR5-6]|uniref:Uncharacterized protein n=1 Tax=Phlebiopsis gigantea (strain 11061_1 CR5-6) TaxID=745531 RepID=A0A0C3RTC1_PHLG1|nr:hypothetical protein PHLGIDRAFT_15590 [Phlebiopsis gigantea 11061_1 CR5-6]
MRGDGGSEPVATSSSVVGIVPRPPVASQRHLPARRTILRPSLRLRGALRSRWARAGRRRDGGMSTPSCGWRNSVADDVSESDPLRPAVEADTFGRQLGLWDDHVVGGRFDGGRYYTFFGRWPDITTAGAGVLDIPLDATLIDVLGVSGSGRAIGGGTSGKYDYKPPHLSAYPHASIFCDIAVDMQLAASSPNRRVPIRAPDTRPSETLDDARTTTYRCMRPRRAISHAAGTAKRPAPTLVVSDAVPEGAGAAAMPAHGRSTGSHSILWEASWK